MQKRGAFGRISFLLVGVVCATLLAVLMEGCGKSKPDEEPPASGAVFSAPGGVQLHKTMPEADRALLRGDLEFLEQNQFLTLDAQLTENLGLSAQPFSGKAMLDWLSERFKIVVGADFAVDSNLSAESLNGVTPQTLGRVAPWSVMDLDPSGKEEGATMMVNYGAQLYLWGRKYSALVYADLGGRKLKIYSPRVGLILSDSLFSSGFYHEEGYAKELRGFRMGRIACYFHEARHSDGNGENIGFRHAECPAGHSYAGKNQCDTATNGPFGIEASMLRTFIKNCDECSAVERQRLRLLESDARDRLLGGNLKKKDPRPEALSGIGPE